MQNTPNEKTKGFFSQIKTAISKPSEYPSFARISNGRAAGFVFLFTFLYMLAVLVIPYIFAMVKSHGFQDYITAYLPDFTISSGELHMDNTYRYDSGNGDVYIYADSRTEYFETDMIHILREEGYDKIALFSRCNFIMYSGGRLQSSSYDGLGSFSRDDIIRFLPYLHLIAAISAVVLYIFIFAGYFFSALIYSLLGLAAQSFIKVRLPFGIIYKLALYSMVAPQLIKAANSLLPFSIPQLTWLCRLITCCYLIYGISCCKKQFIPEQFTGQPGPYPGGGPYGNGSPYSGNSPYDNVPPQNPANNPYDNRQPTGNPWDNRQ